MFGRTRYHAAVALAAAGVIGMAAAGVSYAGHRGPDKLPMIAISLSPKMPEGAVPLITGAPGEMAAKWVTRGTQDAPTWPVSADGVASTGGKDITTREEFGDCFIHIEFRCVPGEDGKMHNSGNSGIGLQGRYEIQMFDSYGKDPGVGGVGALYSQTAPLSNPSKPAGQWQTYDIVFRAPRSDNAGVVVEQPRATVFLNGVIVQNNEAFKGPTGIQYGDFKGQPARGPMVLQGNHDPQQFRNFWVAPIN